MKIAITGSNGFIGSHLVRKFKKDNELLPIDHKLLQKPQSLQDTLELFKPEIILHFAAYGNMAHQKDDDDIFTANIVGTYNLLTASKDIDYKLFINCSTSSVYGRTEKVMQEWRQLRPDTMYAATKACAEHLCRAYRKQHKKKIVTVRPFSVYGPGEAEFRFIPTLICNHKNKVQSSVIEGMHDWIYIDDFVNAIETLINHRDDVTHRTYNVGTGIQTSNIEIAEMITDNYDYVPQKKINDSPVWVADIERLKELNWKPVISVSDGIARCKAYYG